MNLVKLSLVAALAAGSFSALNAKSLEEAIKNVDVSGFARYRYDSMSWDKDGYKNLTAGANAVNYQQKHRYRAFLNTSFGVGDNFKLYGQLMYNNDTNGGFDEGTQTKKEIVLKQAYFSYDLKDAGLSFVLGRQSLGTIWTEDLTGMTAKILFTPADGLTIAAFAVDSIEGADTTDETTKAVDGWQVGDTDATNFQAYLGGKNKDARTLTKRLYRENMYGAAVLAKFGGLDAQIWGNHWDKTATLYAVNLNYKLNLGGGDNIGIKASYLGNVLDGVLKNDAGATYGKMLGNGNLGDLRVSAKISGFDAQLGGIYFGQKDKFTINTLEGLSGIGANAIGREILYQRGSWLPLAYGQSLYGYIGAGYTLPADVRLGVQGVFGETSNDAKGQADKGIGQKMELVAEANYKATKNLNFLLWYSYLTSKADEGKSDNATNPTYSDITSTKSTVRFEAVYRF